MNYPSIDEIFRTLPISEICKLEAKYRTEIEEKTTQIKQTVGEQYRNVIDCGPNVSNLLASSNDLTSSLNKIENLLCIDKIEDANLPTSCNNTKISWTKDEINFSTIFDDLYFLSINSWEAILKHNVLSAVIEYKRVENKYNSVLKPHFANNKLMQLFAPFSSIHKISELDTNLIENILKRLFALNVYNQHLPENLIAYQYLTNTPFRRSIQFYFKQRSLCIQNIFFDTHDSPRDTIFEVIDSVLSTIYQLKTVCLTYSNKDNALHLILRKLLHNDVSLPFFLFDYSFSTIQSEFNTWIRDIEQYYVTNIIENLHSIQNIYLLTSLNDYLLKCVLNSYEKNYTIQCRSDTQQMPYYDLYTWVNRLSLDVIDVSWPIWDELVLKYLIKRFSELLDIRLQKILDYFFIEFKNYIKLGMVYTPNISNNFEIAKGKNKDKANFMNIHSELEVMTQFLIEKLSEILVLIEDFKSKFSSYSNKFLETINVCVKERFFSFFSLFSNFLKEEILNIRQYISSLDYKQHLVYATQLLFIRRLSVNLQNSGLNLIEPYFKTNKIASMMYNSTLFALDPWINYISNIITSRSNLLYFYIQPSDWQNLNMGENNISNNDNNLFNFPTQPTQQMSIGFFLVSFQIIRVLPIQSSLLCNLLKVFFSKYISSYESFLTSSTCNLSKLSYEYLLQMWYDLYYLSSMIIPMWEENFSTVCSLQAKLNSYIDPFDLDFCSPYINQGVENRISSTNLINGLFSSIRDFKTSSTLNSEKSIFNSKLYLSPIFKQVGRISILPTNLEFKQESQNKDILIRCKRSMNIPIDYHVLESIL